MRHPKAHAWEKQLKTVFDEIDHELEAKYGAKWMRHPARPKRGSTPNPAADGLFNVGAAFSAGYGSTNGPGYTVEIRLSTLQKVAEDVRDQIEQEVFQALQAKLPSAFPGKELTVAEDKGLIRIYGDLSLDD